MEQTLRKRGYMNKYIRSFPTFLVIREIHFKAKMRYNFTTTDNTKRLTVLIIGRDRATGALRQRWWEHKTAQLLNLNPHLSHDPAIPLLGSQNKYPLEILKNVHRNFIHDSPKLQAIPISTNREMDRQIVLYLYNGILHSNKNEKLMHKKTQVKLRNIMLSERSMAQNMYCVVLFIWGSKRGKTNLW